MKAPIGSIGFDRQNFCMNNIKVSYKDCTISIAHHLTGEITSAQEVAIIYPNDDHPIEIVDTFDDSVESLEEVIAKAKAIINFNHTFDEGVK